MEPVDSISSYINGIFVDRGTLWKLGGQRSVPTEEDIQQALEKMRLILSSDPESGSIEVGGLIMIKDGGRYGTYVHIGDMNESS